MKFRETVRQLIVRDLAAFERELNAYENEADIWAVPPGITNSAGNLALHAAGNLQHFIGAQLGGTGYVRDRPAEFTDRDVPREELVARLRAAAKAVEQGLDALPDGDLESSYRIRLGDLTLETGDFVAHLATHLAYHLGQVDYHRRIVTGSGKTVDAVGLSETRTARESG